MAHYINCLTTSSDTLRDIKELIADMNMRRRMSKFIKMGVSVGMNCIKDYEDCDCSNDIDAIVTASSLGCIEDSEKFLKTLIDNNEHMLNPTPFIQSTFNTIAAQIAILCKKDCYNMTYSQRYISFESAVLDAIIRLDLGESTAVLVGAMDEVTPTQTAIFERLRLTSKEEKMTEGAVFFVLTKNLTPHSVAQIDSISFNNTTTANSLETNNVTETNNEKKTVKVSESNYTNSFLASAFTFAEAVGLAVKSSIVKKSVAPNSATETADKGERQTIIIINDIPQSLKPLKCGKSMSCDKKESEINSIIEISIL